MSEISKQALKVANNTEFPNNNAGLIKPSNLRAFNEDMIDSLVDEITYNVDSGSWNQRIDALSGSVAVDTGSLLLTASFDNGTRNLTFTKGDSSTFAVNIPDASGSILPSGVVSGSSQIILQDTTGLLSASRIDGEVTNSTYSQNTIVYGKNIYSTSIAKGTPLFFTGSGTSGNLVGILPADAGNPSLMPAGGIAAETIDVGAEGIVLLDGFINNVNTSLFAPGDEVFVAVGGGYTNTPPTGSTNLVQKLGNVEKSAVNGSGVINGPGAVRSVPNIQEGYTWVGDGDGVAQAFPTSSFGTPIDTGSFATTGSNSFVGTQNITGDINQFGGNIVNYVGGNIQTIGGNVAGNTMGYTDGSSVITGSFSGNVTSSIIESQVYINPQTLTGDITIPTAKNAMLVGPVSIDGTLVVEGNSNLLVLSQVSGSGGGSSTDITALNQFTASQEVLNTTFATTGSNIFIGDEIITGSLGVRHEDTGSIGFQVIGQTISQETNKPLVLISGSEDDIPQTGVVINTRVDINAPLYAQRLQINNVFTDNLYSNSGGSTPIRIQTNSVFASQSPSSNRVDIGVSGSIEVSGSVNIYEVMNLSAQDPLPSGNIGDIAVSGSSLYFYNGAWTVIV